MEPIRQNTERLVVPADSIGIAILGDVVHPRCDDLLSNNLPHGKAANGDSAVMLNDRTRIWVSHLRLEFDLCAAAHLKGDTTREYTRKICFINGDAINQDINDAASRDSFV